MRFVKILFWFGVYGNLCGSLGFSLSAINREFSTGAFHTTASTTIDLILAMVLLAGFFLFIWNNKTKDYFKKSKGSVFIYTFFLVFFLEIIVQGLVGSIILLKFSFFEAMQFAFQEKMIEIILAGSAVMGIMGVIYHSLKPQPHCETCNCRKVDQN
ncbi:hypothetical protein HN954_04290 [bacterium]|jgi:hypothetical protein|nr:hypothetical protein [bacterium]MBT6831923.1 hypothetical protein [bacterium]MBT6996619.1 hypothetical protein [bacterium]MBT7773039.1 hypothetical protein [bacterium]